MEGQVRELEDPGKAYSSVLGMVEGLAEVGLVHCDLNEFNLLVRISTHASVSHLFYPFGMPAVHCALWNSVAVSGYLE